MLFPAMMLSALIPLSFHLCNQIIVGYLYFQWLHFALHIQGAESNCQKYNYKFKSKKGLYYGLQLI
ncbi:MAG: hypothetical protein JWP78_3666 [Mucilaginibacter sp.]|nr:hypothetical protein [Mucilaginibacter sp.]